MNPNIQPLAEYLRRRDAAAQAAEKLGIPIIFDDSTWDLAAWLRRQLPVVSSPERCQWCCASRLEACHASALRLGFEHFSTSLLYSRYQPHEHIRDAGFALAADGSVDFVYHDFREGWQRGIDLSIEWQLYRQPYCGCIFRENERYAKKLARLQKMNA